MKSSIQIKKIAQKVIKIEYEQIQNLNNRIDENFVDAICCGFLKAENSQAKD